MPEHRRTLVIVPCGSAKVWDRMPTAGPTLARDAYTGAPFVVNREYAETFGDSWVILSAKYGFLRPEELLPGPYNVTFKNPSSRPISDGALRRQVHDERLDEFVQVIGLGGRDYRLRILEAFAVSDTKLLFPFAGMKLGVSLGAAKRAIASGRPL